MSIKPSNLVNLYNYYSSDYLFKYIRQLEWVELADEALGKE